MKRAIQRTDAVWERSAANRSILELRVEAAWAFLGMEISHDVAALFSIAGLRHLLEEIRHVYLHGGGGEILEEGEQAADQLLAMQILEPIHTFVNTHGRLPKAGTPAQPKSASLQDIIGDLSLFDQLFAAHRELTERLGLTHPAHQDQKLIQIIREIRLKVYFQSIENGPQHKAAMDVYRKYALVHPDKMDLLLTLCYPNILQAISLYPYTVLDVLFAKSLDTLQIVFSKQDHTLMELFSPSFLKGRNLKTQVLLALFSHQDPIVAKAFRFSDLFLNLLFRQKPADLAQFFARPAPILDDVLSCDMLPRILLTVKSGFAPFALLPEHHDFHQEYQNLREREKSRVGSRMQAMMKKQQGSG